MSLMSGRQKRDKLNTFYCLIVTAVVGQKNKIIHNKLLIAGDWNAVLNSEMDAKCAIRSYYKTPQNLKKMIKRQCLCDAWRTLNPKCK